MAAQSNQQLTREWLIRLAKLAVKLTLLLALLLILPSWVMPLYQKLLPRWLERKLSIYFLTAVFVTYYLALAVALSALGLLCARLARIRRRGLVRPRWVVRLLAACLVYGFGLMMLEGGAAAVEWWNNRLPVAPESPDRGGLPALPVRLAESNDKGLYIVVLGGSSARGEPFHPWLSVGQILGWELEHVFPGRKIEVDVKASGGLALEQATAALAHLPRRPDAVLIYSGHNEFQARYSWNRRVNYYDDDWLRTPREVFIDQAFVATPFCRLVRDAIEHQQIDEGPSPIVSRGLLDRPVCTPAEYDRVLNRFDRQLDYVVSHCERLGALPILVLPAGNEVDFEPSCSYLDPKTTRARRNAFASRFDAAHGLEAADPEAAIHAYRMLIAEQPRFAESHYRLAKLLQARQDWAGARTHYRVARDLDGLPIRCPSRFQAVYLRVAARHNAILVDADKVMRALSPHGLLEGFLFQDGHHPTLYSYVALSQVALDALKARGAFGWPENVPAPAIDPAECARRAGLDSHRWSQVCRRSARFYNDLAYVRHDPKSRLHWRDFWLKAAAEVDRGRSPEELGVKGFGVHPQGLLPPPRSPAISRREATGQSSSIAGSG
jgi:hypothetical protein